MKNKSVNHALLDKWALDNFLSNQDIANMILEKTGQKIVYQNVYSWRTGFCQPSRPFWPAIEKMTAGKVKAAKWIARFKPEGSGRKVKP